MDVFETMKKRLIVANYSRETCLAALRGEAIPEALGNDIHRVCVVRGIRYHYPFGHELRGVLPVFTRSLNASSIMANVIPDMQSPDEIPYCIWHPLTASEQTYRQLAVRYPHMAYQVGRACAVAGYLDLYKELDILPDAHTAEEARECGNFELFEWIMSQPARYSVMNDYERKINADHPQPVFLNGDTAVKWMLDVKQGIQDATEKYSVKRGKLNKIFHSGWPGYENNNMFDLTEDMSVDERDSDGIEARLLPNRLEMQLLSSPLPADLPTVQKDVLILMAAYTGDVDRYARLRRPRDVQGEMACCLRGIYHNTFFALWWSRQTREDGLWSWVQRAINARFIMNNVLSRVPHWPGYTPYLIWWPIIAQESTYRRLATLQPDMLPQIVHAAMVAEYDKLFDELLPQLTPDLTLIKAARVARNPRYLKALEERSLVALGKQPSEYGDFRSLHYDSDFEPSIIVIHKYVSTKSVTTTWESPYDGHECNAAQIELMAMLPEKWMMDQGFRWNFRDLDYIHWPLPPDGTGEVSDSDSE